jgi:hypothetical protein
MRYQLALVVVAACVGGSSIAAHAQAPVVVNRAGDVAGTSIVAGTAAVSQLGAGTGGIDPRGGRATGGITPTTRAGTGGILDIRRGAGTGGLKE